jgi:preprotein translocase subunit SecG
VTIKEEETGTISSSTSSNLQVNKIEIVDNNQLHDFFGDQNKSNSNYDGAAKTIIIVVCVMFVLFIVCLVYIYRKGNKFNYKTATEIV